MASEATISDDRLAPDEYLWGRILGAASSPNIVRPADIPETSVWWRLYGPLAECDPDAGFVVGQLGQSLDGRVATETGHSHYINGPEGIRHLHRLRALVNAVVVGVGTVIADDPQLTVRHVPGPHPARVVIDPNGRLPAAARLLDMPDGGEVLVIQSCDRPRPPHVSRIILPRSGGRIPPAAIVDALRARGYRRILIEGGAWTVSAFLAAGMLDRLHVCVAPLVIGSGPIGISLPPVGRLDSAMRPKATIHRLGDDILFDCEIGRTDVRSVDPGQG